MPAQFPCPMFNVPDIKLPSQTIAFPDIGLTIPMEAMENMTRSAKKMFQNVELDATMAVSDAHEDLLQYKAHLKFTR